MDNEKKDIFDKIMHLPLLNIFEPLYKKYKAILLYLFFGFLSFLISVGTFAWFKQSLHMNELIANVISWIITVLFAFLTNRIWVFQSPTETLAGFFRQMTAFYAGRVVTLVIEEVILLIFITWLHYQAVMVKVFAQIIVIVLNYIISKLIIFRKKD